MNQRKAYIFALLSILSWSTVATAFKIGLRHLDFVQLLFYSVLFAIIILFIVLIFQKKIRLVFTYTRNDYLKSAFLGLINPFGYYMVLLKAYSLLPAQIAQPLNYTWPIMLVLLSIPFLGQKLTLRSFVAIIISFLGVFFISLRGNFDSFDVKEPFGVFLALISSVFWAFFWIFNVKDKRDEVVKLFLNFVFGLIYIIIALVVLSDFRFENINGLYSSAYIGMFEFGLPFVFWLKALKIADSTDKISNLVFLSPFLALIFIHLILGETIFYTTIIGLVLIVSGIIVQQIKLNKRKTAYGQ